VFDNFCFALVCILDKNFWLEVKGHICPGNFRKGLIKMS
jgi:hypothetical protein